MLVIFTETRNIVQGNENKLGLQNRNGTLIYFLFLSKSLISCQFKEQICGGGGGGGGGSDGGGGGGDDDDDDDDDYDDDMKEEEEGDGDDNLNIFVNTSCFHKNLNSSE